MRRVAVTGIGVISPLGNSTGALLESLAAARSGICRLEGADYERLANPIAAPAAWQPTMVAEASKLRMMDRTTQFALDASRQALTQAGLPLATLDSSRVGVFIGTGMGGAHSTDDGYRTLYAEQSDRIKPFSVLLAMNNAAASWIGLEYGFTGPNLTFTTACSSSAVAIGEAAMRIGSGAADVMLAGGTEAPLSLGPMKAWEAIRTIATQDPQDAGASCKPFSKDRSGMVLGEGAAIVLMEEWESALARDALILAEVIGYGLATDASHLTHPSVEGQARAMRLALASARIDAASVDYINAHGTGTLANDPVETAAIKQVFGQHANTIPVSSTKSMHGHLLGAAGALEFAIAILAMNAGVVPPTANLRQPDPACDLDYVPNHARADSTIRTVMSNSFAFGGTGVALIGRRAFQ
ncbi:MAG: 3-oxoacyl-[acyl-carrier-protein] synthase [Massilia sp.]|jgi:3-oxoacyl-[acyl-carrier-protein] synthase II|nr:3-oxoacyl-[acyl-carrier-protein] synthase [Massilia sp.]MDB5792234.1 3-oxoacyl-[acyl-carrier-protein] synthase [Massilia sp.]